MGFRVGDAVFDRNGQPGIVSKQDSNSKEFTVDRQKAQVKKSHRHGYVNGLEQNERVDYLKVLDEVSSITDPKQKVSALQTKIDDLKLDPNQYKMVGYLEAELFHVMNTHGVKPRTYQISVID